MLRENVLIDNITQSKLGPEVLDELVACLWPKDCQTCGWSLGSEPCALVVSDMIVMVHATLHHPKCSEPKWNDSGLIEFNRGPMISWVAGGILIPTTGVSNQISYMPGMILNPSLETVSLRREKGEMWQFNTLSRFREIGFRSPQEEIQIENPIPDSFLVITPSSWRVTIAGALETYETGPGAHLTELAIKWKGILVIITQAVDPNKLKPEDIRTVMSSRQTIVGWVSLYKK